MADLRSKERSEQPSAVAAASVAPFEAAMKKSSSTSSVSANVDKEKDRDIKDKDKDNKEKDKDKKRSKRDPSPSKSPQTLARSTSKAGAPSFSESSTPSSASSPSLRRQATTSGVPSSSPNPKRSSSKKDPSPGLKELPSSSSSPSLSGKVTAESLVSPKVKDVKDKDGKEKDLKEKDPKDAPSSPKPAVKASQPSTKKEKRSSERKRASFSHKGKVGSVVRWATNPEYRKSVSLDNDGDEFTFDDESDEESSHVGQRRGKADDKDPMKKLSSGGYNIFMTALDQDGNQRGFLDFYTSARFSDVTLVLPNKTEYKAHKLILAYSSIYFYELFIGNIAKEIEQSAEFDQKKSPKEGRKKESSKDEEKSKESDKKANKKGKGKTKADADDAGSETDEMELNVSLSDSSDEELITEENSDSSDEETLGESTTSISESVSKKETDAPATVKLEYNDNTGLFGDVLKFMYRGTIHITVDNCVALMAIARIYKILSLQKLVRDFFRINLQRETAMNLLEETIVRGETVADMTQVCINMTARNFCYLYEVDYTKLSPEMFVRIVSQKKLAVRDEFALYTTICDYLERRVPTVSDKEAAKLFSFVRFRFCTYRELEQVVRNLRVPQALLVEALMARLKPHELEKESQNEADKNDKARPFLSTVNSPASSIALTAPSSASLQAAVSTVAVSSGSSKPTTMVSSTSNPNLSTVTPSPATPATAPAKEKEREKDKEKEREKDKESTTPPSKSPRKPKSARDPKVAKVGEMEDTEDLEVALVRPLNLDESATLEDDPYLPERLQARAKFDVVFDYYPGTSFFKGVIGWIATNYGRSDWKNPHLSGRVKVHCSSLAKGSRATLVDVTPAECWTSDVPSSWYSIDFGPHRRISPSYYSLRHGGNYKADALRTWDLQGSTDGESWKTINRHANNASLNGPFAISSFPVTGLMNKESFRLFRILQTGHNSSNRNFLVLSGIEFYGVLHDN